MPPLYMHTHTNSGDNEESLVKSQQRYPMDATPLWSEDQSCPSEDTVDFVDPSF